MMKKLGALLIALLLPLCAAAEGVWNCCISWNADEAGTAKWLQAAGIGASQTEKIAGVSAQLMNILGIDLVYDASTHRWQAELGLDDWQALVLDGEISADQHLVQCSVLKGVTFVMPMELMLSPAAITGLAGALTADGSAWLSTLNSVTETGSFTADAYTCVTRRIIAFDDRDLAALLQLLSQNSVMKSWVTPDWLQETAHQLSVSNAGQGRLILGYDAEDNMTGISLTLGAADEAYLTASVGMQNEQASLVICWSDALNTWFAEGTVALSGLLGLDTVVTVSKAPRGMTYAAAKQQSEQVARLTNTISVSYVSIVSDTVLELPTGVLGSETVMSLNGGTQIVTTVTSGAEKTPAWTCTMQITEDERLQPLVTDGTLMLSDYTEADILQTIQTIDTSAILSWQVELIRALPASLLDLLTYGY